MAKLESTFKNMVLVLCGVSILSAGALGLVYGWTLDPIKQAESAKQEMAVRLVTPEFDNEPVKESYWLVSPEGDSLRCFPAKKDGKLTGVAIESFSKKGFHGEIKVMVGLYPDGRICNYSVIKHSETPGLGSKMETWFRTAKNKQNVLGLNPGKDKVWVSKDGGAVDAITAATISSRAFLDAMDRAYRSYMAGMDVELDARTGASAQKKAEVVLEKEPSKPIQLKQPIQLKSQPKPSKIRPVESVEEVQKIDAQSGASSNYPKQEGEIKHEEH